MTTTPTLASIAAQLEQATKGPWQVSASYDVTGYPVFSIHGMSGDEKRDTVTLNAIAAFIASAPTNIAWLIGENRRLEGECQSLAATQCESPSAGEYGHMVCMKLAQAEARCKAMARLLLECRDALPAISVVSARLHNVDMSLDRRIEKALEPWRIPDEPKPQEGEG